MFTLETPRLVLRSFLETDVRTFAAYRSDPLVARFQGWEIPYTLERATAFVAAMARAEPGCPGEWFQVAIERTSDGTMIGDCAFQVLTGDSRQACVGLTLAREHQGRGYATEALVRLLDHLLEERGLHRVVAICDASNRASQRLLERVGMSLEGRFRENVRFLATFANLATLLGLLGTVSGLIHAFAAVATANPMEKANLLSASISEAMNCTAFGLMSAIPLLLFPARLTTTTGQIRGHHHRGA